VLFSAATLLPCLLKQSRWTVSSRMHSVQRLAALTRCSMPSLVSMAAANPTFLMAYVLFSASQISLRYQLFTDITVPPYGLSDWKVYAVSWHLTYFSACKCSICCVLWCVSQSATSLWSEILEDFYIWQIWFANELPYFPIRYTGVYSTCSAVTILKSRSKIAIFCQNRPKLKSLHLLVMFRFRHVSIFCSN